MVTALSTRREPGWDGALKYVGLNGPALHQHFHNPGGTMEQLMAHCGSQKLSRDQLVDILPPEATDTFKPIKHADLVGEVHEALARRQLSIVKDEYAVSEDGMRLFGVMDLATSASDFRFSIGIRNANDKSMRFGMVSGIRVFVCDNMAFNGEFFAIQAKHTKKLQIMDSIALGIDRIQRNFKPLTDQVEHWKANQLSVDRAKAIIFDAFIGKKLDAPQHIAKLVSTHYFEPQFKEFEPRTTWSLNNAFTSAFKALEPIPQFRATASLGEFFSPMN
jgi:hypothetical protein